MIEAECHCGNIKLEANSLPVSVTNCNCSICNRYGALWAYYTPGDVSINEGQPSSVYSWGEKNIEFHYCTICGCVTHYVSVKEYKGERVAINARMMKPETISSIPVRNFDGAVSWKYLD